MAQRYDLGRGGSDGCNRRFGEVVQITDNLEGVRIAVGRCRASVCVRWTWIWLLRNAHFLIYLLRDSDLKIEDVGTWTDSDRKRTTTWPIQSYCVVPYTRRQRA